MGLLGSSKDAKPSKAALAEQERAQRGPRAVQQVAPPAYTAVEEAPASVDDVLTPALGGLSLTEALPGKPSGDACLAHLRLLYAFQVLKNEVGYHDGLFDIWDERAVGGNPQILAALREKRWALYVARAVDRYTAWWHSFVPEMLREADMVAPGVQGREGRYDQFTKEAKAAQWTEDMLPPIDVILVWHAHMLNPRLYLEDCIRYGHGSIWAGGMPWDAVNKAIDRTFKMPATESRISNWAQRTSREWSNEDDPDLKDLRCPNCPATLSIPWTTCGLPQGYKGDHRPGLVGEGYGDGKLKASCECGFVVTHDSLRVAKLRDDINKNIIADQALPGTIIPMESGIPELLPEKELGEHEQLFPGRMARRALLLPVVEMLKPGSAVEPTMLSVSEIFEEYTGKFADSKNLKRVQDLHGLKRVERGAKKAVDVTLSKDSRRQMRKLMSRYWENASIFSIDLVGCVIRQSGFTENMVQLNWLHLPTSRQVMKELLVKYDRFVEIIANYPDEVAAPTLDIDLAWHTHQSSPKSYYDHMVLQTKTFIDHNDRIDEQKLGSAFQWTTKVYQERYGEVYAQCRCWYCEVTRVMTVGTLAGMFGKQSKEEKFLENYHASGQSAKHPEGSSEPSVHISAHNSVHTIETKARAATARKHRLPFRNGVTEAEEKARRRAKKQPLKGAGGKERMGPKDQNTASFWGVKVPILGPWASATAAATTGAIYAAAPGVVTLGPGSVGSCGSGTCGGGTGCGTEMVGMCFAGCTGSGWMGGNAGCAR
ncbi:hypothetical protein F5X68DRAFT_11359 [Plectosphaerella plurivora]|uniref:Uncharacterized protein n=1 Tax=Plectosphaerella plurivora TaxID=936078 RepID=A0A9P9AAJ6_9PEZI|nr:hypothetical protein F5X68DRAFT_11359 [Plectosphaerella plurivora]